MTPRSTLSVSHCRTRRVRLAPSAWRIAVSRRRTDARATRRPAMFAHAIKSTSATTAITRPAIGIASSRSLGSIPPLICRSCARRSVSLSTRPKLVSATRRATVANSDAACSRVTPSLSRAKTASQWFCLSSNLPASPPPTNPLASEGLSVVCIESGTQRSRLRPTSVPMKFSGATPTTVKPRPLREI